MRKLQRGYFVKLNAHIDAERLGRIHTTRSTLRDKRRDFHFLLNMLVYCLHFKSTHLEITKALQSIHTMILHIREVTCNEAWILVNTWSNNETYITRSPFAGDDPSNVWAKQVHSPLGAISKTPWYSPRPNYAQGNTGIDYVTVSSTPVCYCRNKRQNE